MPTRNRTRPTLARVPIALIAPRPPAASSAGKSRARRVMLSPTLPHRILLNAALVAQALKRRDGHVDAILVEPLVPSESLEAAERGDELARLELAKALSAQGATYAAIGDVLGTDKSEVSRLIRLSALPELLDAYTSGTLSLSHAKRLANQPEAVWRKWLRDGTKLTVRRLEERLSPSPTTKPWEPDPDTLKFVQAVSGALQTGVSLTRVEDRWQLELSWTKLTVLQGLLENLGKGDAWDIKGLPERPRALRVELDSTDELNAFLGHLISGD